MIKTTALGLTALLITATGCTPAKITSIPQPIQAEASTVHVYREAAFNAGGASLIFGYNNQDLVELGNDDYSEIKLKEGAYQFFVRSNHADEPYIFPMQLKAGEEKCLKAYANPSNIGKALVPLAYHFTNTFLLENVQCLSNEQFKAYKFIPVKYK